MKGLIKEEKKSEFPIEIFPKAIQNYILEANDTLDSNIDYMGCSMLWGVSVLLGNSFAVEVKKGWLEYANIWVACIGAAGVGKTPSISMATRPFERINSELISSFPRLHKEWEEAKGDKDADHCNSEKNSIQQMREWMKNHNKDFYSIYYVNGIDYEIVK